MQSSPDTSRQTWQTQWTRLHWEREGKSACWDGLLFHKVIKKNFFVSSDSFRDMHRCSNQSIDHPILTLLTPASFPLLIRRRVGSTVFAVTSSLVHDDECALLLVKAEKADWQEGERKRESWNLLMCVCVCVLAESASLLITCLLPSFPHFSA